jgi:hypothetical protein
MSLLPDLVGGVRHGAKRARGGGVADDGDCWGVLVDAAREAGINSLRDGDHRRGLHGGVDGRAGRALDLVGYLGHWGFFHLQMMRTDCARVSGPYREWFVRWEEGGGPNLPHHP